MILLYIPTLKEAARELRINMTDTENFFDLRSAEKSYKKVDR